MSGEFTFGDNSDEFCFSDFSWSWLTVTSQSIRSLRHWRCHDCTQIWNWQGNQTVHIPRRALIWQTRRVRLFNHFLEQTGNPSFNLPFNAVRIRVMRIRGKSSWSESMTDEKYEQIMLRVLVPVVYAVCSWKPEADRWYFRSTDWGRDRTGEQIPWSCATVSWTFTLRKSKCFRHELVWNRPFDPDLCCQSDVLVRAQFDAHARLFSVVLSLTFMITDNPHWLKCHLKPQIILHRCLHHDVVVLKLLWSSSV